MARLSGAELEAQGRARHCAGDYAGAVKAYEQAHAAYRAEGDSLAAARCARTVGWFRGWIFGDWAVHRGWAGRARRLLEQADPPSTRLEGWLLLDTARAGHDLASQQQCYHEVIQLARACGDSDLECEATASLGMMLVFSGLVDEGMGYLDEALAALCAGDIDELPVLEGCLCGLFNACERTLDVGRAEQWLRAADDVISRRKLVAVAGYCRAHYAGILIAAGRWDEAEAELSGAIDTLPDGLGVRATARCRLADLRLRQGRIEEAAELLIGLEHHEDAVRPLARVHLVRGGADVALELLERALSATAEGHVMAPLLALMTEAHLALADNDAAAATSGRLSELAGDQPRYVKAIAAVAEARTRRARRDGDGRAHLHRAMALFADARMPYELACTRLELARAVAEDRPRVAVIEATAALEAFDELGAARDVDAAAAVLRSLGAPARTGPKGLPGLTRREQEVLEVVANGLTNAEIADRLFISPKTVEHHVGRILSKLGLRSRSEAAVYAVRRAK